MYLYSIEINPKLFKTYFFLGDIYLHFINNEN